ncbi:hypothetical protein OKJ48_04755 [Streptomyces kunmingensis]|uniref:Uncharacterized protein n=1 Tax=Streptomyces kunmingensis TaxID=68225 RepID=A0ABU6C4T5_9ACTN|nr:hypothetical protein [Streptomyces kunmingensis]MEB3959563.1 hypothetical protein [Streptomyces kunmingensis]
MSDTERTANEKVLEPPERRKGDRTSPRNRWLRRLRREVGLGLVRGAATTVGGVVVTYGLLWFQSR